MNIVLEQVHEIIYKDVDHICGSPGTRKCLSTVNNILLYSKCVNIFPENPTFFAYRFLKYGNADSPESEIHRKMCCFAVHK